MGSDIDLMQSCGSNQSLKEQIRQSLHQNINNKTMRTPKGELHGNFLGENFNSERVNAGSSNFFRGGDRNVYVVNNFDEEVLRTPTGVSDRIPGRAGLNLRYEVGSGSGVDEEPEIVRSGRELARSPARFERDLQIRTGDNVTMEDIHRSARKAQPDCED